MNRLKATITIPLGKHDFERDFNTMSKNMGKMEELCEKLNGKCSMWKKRFSKHNIDNYTLKNYGETLDTVPTQTETYYVDSSGYMDLAPPNDSANYYAPFAIPLSLPKNQHQCRFVGHNCKCKPHHVRHHDNENLSAHQCSEEIFQNTSWSGSNLANVASATTAHIVPS
jgi:hypothetical protein